MGKVFELLKILASTDVFDFIDQKANGYYKEILSEYKDRLSEAEWKELMELIDLIPERKSVIHSDPHAGNIMIQDGELLFVDMDEMMQGHPILDLAALHFNYTKVLLSPSGPKFLRIPKETAQAFLAELLDLYFAGLNESDRAVVMKALELLSLLRHAVAATAYQRGNDSEKGKTSRDLVEKDLKNQILGYKQELLEGLALFPDIAAKKE